MAQLFFRHNGELVSVSQGPKGDPGPPGVPDGGTTGQVLGKLSDEDKDADWIDQTGGGGGGVPDGGTTGQVLGKLSDTDGDADWVDPGVQSAETDTIRTMTWNEYQALPTKDPRTLYIIRG